MYEEQDRQIAERKAWEEERDAEENYRYSKEYMDEQRRIQDEQDRQDAERNRLAVQRQRTRDKYLNVNNTTPIPGDSYTGKKTSATYDEFLRDKFNTNDETELFKKTAGATPRSKMQGSMSIYRRAPVVDPALLEDEQEARLAEEQRRMYEEQDLQTAMWKEQEEAREAEENYRYSKEYMDEQRRIHEEQDRQTAERKAQEEALDEQEKAWQAWQKQLDRENKDVKALTRAENRYIKAKDSAEKLQREQAAAEAAGEAAGETGKNKDYEEWLAMLNQATKARKNSNNVFFGDMDQGTWGSARPEGVSQAWLIKNIDSMRAEYETAKETGEYDNTSDVFLWSEKKRSEQKVKNLEDELKIQSEIDEIHRMLESGTGMPRLEDENVQKYREILMGDYSDEEKEEAQARLEELYEQGENAEVDRDALVERERNLTSQLRYIKNQNTQIDGADKKAQKYRDAFGNYTPNDTAFHSDIEERYSFSGKADVAYIYQLLEEKKLNGEHQIFGERNYPEAYLMNKKETDYFISYVNEGKLDEAWSFYAGLRPYLNEAYSKYEASMWEDFANRFPILSFFAARGANVMQIPQFILNIPGYGEALATGKDNYTTDTYGKMHAQSRIKSLIDNKITNNAGDFGWVYSGFASGVDSAINASIAQGLGLPETVQFGNHIFKAQNAAMLSLFASQAFETSLQNVMAQGNNNFVYDFMEAFVDSVIETATEIWSVENFLKEPTNLLTYVKNLIISEPSEEVAGAIIEPFIKEMIGHGNSYISRADEIWHNGYYEDANGNKVTVGSYEEAERQAMREWNHDIRMAAQEALVSVAPGGMYGAAKMTVENRTIGRQVQEKQFENGTTGLGNMLEAAKSMDAGTRSYQEAEKIAKRMADNKNAGDYRVGQFTRDLMRESQEQAEEKSRQALHDDIFKELSGKEIRGSNVDEMTDLIVKAIDEGGIDNLSRKEREKIHDTSIGYNTYLKYVYASEQSTRAMRAQLDATAMERKAMQSVSDALSNSKNQTTLDDDFVGKQLASQSDIERAEGKRTKAPDEVIVDRKFAKLNGMKLMKNEEGTKEWKYEVQTENGPEYKNPNEIQATNFSTAAVIRQQQMNPEIFSGDYTNELLKQVNTQQNTKIGNYMMEALNVRVNAFLGKEMPKTVTLSDQQAKDIYRISQKDLQTEWAKDQESRQSNFKGRGNGQAFFGDVEFGTDAWKEKLDGLDLNREERQLVDGLAAFAVDSGIRFDFVDKINGTDNIHGSEGAGGIRIALDSYDSKTAKEQGQRHNLTVTVGHELTHWLRRNNPGGYIELQDYVVKSMSSRGVNMAQRVMEMVDSRKKNGDNLTLSQAIEEIVADACDQTMNSDEAIQHLEETSPKLAEKIRSFIQDLVQRIKAAIGTEERWNSASRDAMMFVGKEANRLHKLWWGKFDEVLDGQVKQLEAAAEGREAASMAEGEERFSRAVYTNGLEKGMTDKQRFDVLKGTRIKVTNAAGKITNNELTYYGGLKKYNSTEAFRKLALRNGIINTQFENKYIKNLPAVFSLKSLRESMHHHNEEGYTNLAALMPVFKETFENAVPIMAQDDRYRYVVRDKTGLKTYIQLLGAFEFGNQIIPVKFEIKENEINEEGKLYIVATINKDAILTNAPQMSGTPAPASSEISIEDTIQKVNKDDIDILYTLPAQFLTGEQLKGKRLGLAKNGNYIRAKAEEKNKTKNYHVDMTQERINSLIDEYGDNSNAYVAYINPQSFVDLTAKDNTQVMNESHPMNGSELRNEKQTPVIRIDSSTGDIISSDGQKRLQAMALAGVKQAAVLVVDENAANNENRNTIDSLDIHGNNINKTLKGLVPVDSQHRDELISTFSNENGWFKYSMSDLNAEYEDAFEHGDVVKAEQMLMDRYQEMEKYGIIGYRAPHFNSGEYAEIAKKIKKGDPEAISKAAKDMAEMVPENAVLVPMPPHSGQVTEETDTMLLARAISEITGAPVINALESGEHISRLEAKEKNIRGVSAESMGFQQVAEIPEDAMPVYIDNMVGGGVTAKAAHDAVGRGITLAYAQSARAKIGGAKFVGITKNNGELIPLDERMDPNNKSWKYSMSEEAESGNVFSITDPDSANVGAWMMMQTPSSVHTEGERALIQEYRGLKTSLELTRMKLNDYNSQLRKLQAKGMLTAEERDQVTELKNRIQLNEDKQARLEQELYEVTRTEGYAGMMYRNSKVFDDYINGKNQQQVEAAVDTLTNEAERAEKNIAKRQKAIRKMADDAAISTIRRELKSRGLSFSANALKKTYWTNMSTGELEGRLAEIVLKAVNGEEIRADIESLANDVATNTVGFGNEIAEEALSNVRGMTIVIGPGQQAEMKANHLTLKELRERTKGSGVTFKYGDHSTLDVNAEDIGKMIPELRDKLGNEKQSLMDFVGYVENLLAQKKGNAVADYGVNPEEVAVVITACAQQMLDEKQGGMSRETLQKRIANAQGEIGKLAEAVDELMESAKAIKNSAVTASNAAGGLRGDAVAAIDYYNLIARQAAEVERNRVKRTVIEQLRSENTKKLIEQQQKYEEMMKKDRRARELAKDNEHLRKVITTDAKRLKDRLVAETDTKNIPEEAKPLARMLVSMLVNHDMAGWRHVLYSDKQTMADVQLRLAKMEAASGPFDMDTDLDWLVIKAPNAEDNDTSIRDKVLQDLMDIESGLVEYRNAEGRGNVSLQDRKAALTKIQEAVSEIYDVIKARESAFIQAQKWNVEELARMLERDMENSRFKGERKGRGSRVKDWFWNDVGYGNLTPEYFFKNLRNRTMNLLQSGLHEAEQRSGLEAREAQKRIAQIAEETGYATWDGQEKHAVKLSSGKVIEMTTEQLMALYATWNREKNQLRPEETAHLLKGGFVLAEGDTTQGRARRERSTQRPNRVNEADMESIGGYLTEQQRAFVDKIVAYMSKDMAEIGNEASLKAYGIKKFTESYYFPIKSWGGVLNKSSVSGVTNNNDNRAMRQSFTKRLTANAQNALEIGDFTPTAMKHITGMITFNTVGPAVENINKVLNQQLDYYEDEEMDPDEKYKRNMRAAFAENYGQMALGYLEQFMKDVNGGVARRNETILREKLLSIFKKNAVAGSMSVAAQQPLSYIRAAMLINPKYLAQAISPQYWKGSYEEMMSHSGIAVIKEMGKFDMNFGQSMTDYITPEGMKSKWDKVQDAGDKLTSLPGKMDAMTWTRMWSAVKLEQAALHPEMDTKSEDFLDMVADRFNELMRRTQVYDSVMVKSQNMRSEHYIKKMATSFMAEPTLSLNVLADAWMNLKEKGGKANAAKALATFMLSAAAQAGVKAFFGTGRSPDKKKTEEENYLNKFLQNLLSEMNPLGLIPGFSQLTEALINGELNDDAMGMIGKAKDAVQKMIELASGNVGKKGWYRDLEDSIGQVAQIATDVPLKNIMRDFRAMVNWFSGGTSTWTGDQFAQRESSAAVIRIQSMENLMTKELGGLMNALLGEAGYKTDNTSYVKRIYNAKKNGNEKEAADLREYMEKVKLNGSNPGKWIDSQLNSLTKEDDSLSTEEKMESLGENGYGSMGKYINDQYRAGEIDRKTAEEYYRKENPNATDKDVAEFLDKTDWEKDGKPLADGQKSYTNYTPLLVAVENNRADEIRSAVERMVQIGYTEKNIKTKLNSEIKKKYLAADANERIRLKDAMQKAYKSLGFTAEDADKTINGWTKEKKGK